MENSLTLMQEKAITVLQSSLYPGASTESVLMVLDYCKARKLDPFLKPVHIVPMWDSKSKTMRDVVMPGLNLYRTRQQNPDSLPAFPSLSSERWRTLISAVSRCVHRLSAKSQ